MISSNYSGQKRRIYDVRHRAHNFTLPLWRTTIITSFEFSSGFRILDLLYCISNHLFSHCDHVLWCGLTSLGVIPSTLLHLPLDFIHVSSLQLMYLCPFGRPFIYSLFRWVPGLELALVPDVVVPQVEQGCVRSKNLNPNFCPGRVRTSDLSIYRPRTLPLDYRAHLLLVASYDMQEDTAGQF